MSNGGSFLLSLTKVGNGTQTLPGASTYTGATAVSGGTLELALTGSLSTGTDVTVGAATLEIDATGKTLKSLTVADGTTLALPGASAATTTVTNALTFTGTPNIT